MHKCCANCASFHCCLGEYDSQYHIHDYCDEWDRTNMGPMRSLINNFLNDFYAEGEILYDDNETGESYCYLFIPGVDCQDERLERCFNHNKTLALNTIDKILETQIFKDKITNKMCQCTADDLEYFKRLRDRIAEKEF